MTDSEFKKSTLIKLSKGASTIAQLKKLIKIYENRYKLSGKQLNCFIEFRAFNEMKRRLTSSVFSEIGKTYPIGYRKYCIAGEYHNTKLNIDTIRKVIEIGKKRGDITNPNFFGQPSSEYSITLETIVHLLLRHNEAINNLINMDSLNNGHNPSSFNGAVALPLMIMFTALTVIEETDWKKASVGKNLICHFCVGGQLYTVIRKGASKEIHSFYPRNDDMPTDFLRLKRKANKMEFEKE